MNKSELIAAIAEEAGISKSDAGSALDAFVNTVTNGLANGDRISLVGFGTWSVDERAARTGRNPRTGESIEIAARNVVKFKVGATLNKAVN